MTQLLEKAVAQLHELSTEEQDAIATLILDELADEAQWDEAFAGTQAQLARWADKVRQDIKAGRVRQQGIDEL
jgi:hypothetical protein